MSAPLIAAREDIHRSCKSLEVVVNILNDYCEAATAIVAIQKKLAKALRDAASTRNVSEIAANALNASATIFEAMCEVDAKFSKLTDKECDGISAEVKKWFKKLAKEEKAHDERVANANYRIKQAGQIYERKVKKNPEDVAEEHNRYISLLSSLGPEVTQEKHNHAVAVSQRHSDTLFSVAACMARVADAEWLRACEGVRRMSPCAGAVGEWRALCEGGWNGPTPPDLPGMDVKSEQNVLPSSQQQILQKTPNNANDVGRTESLPPSSTLAPEYTSRTSPPTGAPQQANRSAGPANGMNSGPVAIDDGPLDDDGRDRSHSVNSIASLGSFPAPPTHYPLPPVTAVKQQTGLDTPNNTGNVPNDTPDVLSTPKSSMDVKREETLLALSTAKLPAQTQDTSQAQGTQRGDDTFLDLNSPTSSPANAMLGKGSTSMATIEEQSQDDLPLAQPPSQGSSTRASEHTPIVQSQPLPLQAAQASQPTKMPASPRVVSGPRASMLKRGDYIDDAEFGVRRSSEIPTSVRRSLDRSDTGQSNGSLVREKYPRSTGPAALPPSDVPRLPMSVSALASRYEYPGDASGSAQTSGRTPTAPGVTGRVSQDSMLSQHTGTFNLNERAASPLAEELNRRKQRLQELEELELREQEYELRVKGREIEQKARQLEQDRMRLRNARGMMGDEYESDSSHNNLRPPLVESPGSSPVLQTRHPYASSSSQLPTPRQPQRYASQQSLVGGQPPVMAPQRQLTKQLSHDPSRDVQPPLAPITLRQDKQDKPKGWIRRLSMPVMGNAFSDTKKGISNTTYAPSAGMRNSFVYPGDGQMNSKNRSTTNLGRR